MENVELARIINSQKVLLLGSTLNHVKKLARSETKMNNLAQNSPPHGSSNNQCASFVVSNLAQSYKTLLKTVQSLAKDGGKSVQGMTEKSRSTKHSFDRKSSGIRSQPKNRGGRGSRFLGVT